MKALVKAKAEPGLWLEDVPVPEIGINDVLIQVRAHRHLRHRPAHLQLGRLGPARPSRCRWSSATSSSARSSRSARTSTISTPARSSAARATWSAAAAATAWPAGGTCASDTQGVGVNRPGAFAEYLALPMTNVWHHAPAIDRGRRRDLRPVRQRGPHGAFVRRAGRGRADHRRRADRHHGGRRRAARRGPLRRGHRRQPLPAGTGPARWARRCAVDVRTETLWPTCRRNSA